MKRWLKRVALGVLFSVVLTTIGLTWDWYSTRRAGQKKLDAVIAKLNAEDPGWRLHDLNDARNAKLPPDEKNGAVIIQRAVALIPKSFDDWTKEKSDRFAVDEPNRLRDRAMVAELGPTLAECRPALDKLKSATALPPGGNRIVIGEPNPMNTFLNETQRMRMAVHLLSTHAAVSVATGDTAAATDDVLQIIAVARNLSDEPMLISQLVRIALTVVAVNATESILATAPDGAPNLPEIQAAFAAEIPVPRLVFGLRGERGMFMRITENLDSGRMSLDDLADGGKSGPGFSPGFAQFRQYIPDQQAVGTELLTELIAAATRSRAERRAVGDAMELRVRGMTERRYTLVRLLLPAITRVCDADDRAVAQLGCAVAGIACERFRQKTGSWPKALADIPKDIFSEIPTDPFTGKSVLFKRTETGAVVYSVGSDGVDDGGETLDPKMPPGTDVGFRLYDPAHRRLPAKPKPPADGEEPK
jgi:hypothetical protein